MNEGHFDGCLLEASEAGERLEHLHGGEGARELEVPRLVEAFAYQIYRPLVQVDQVSYGCGWVGG